MSVSNGSAGWNVDGLRLRPQMPEDSDAIMSLLCSEVGFPSTLRIRIDSEPLLPLLPTHFPAIALSTPAIYIEASIKADKSGFQTRLV
jgi:hypothetical protein